MNAAPARVSVVLPCYNAEVHVESAVRHLLGLEGDGVEIIAVDDASTDSTGAILARLARQHPALTVITQPQNEGVAAAREAAVEAARGEYVWFVDDDDEWPADAVATMLAVADGTDADIVCAAAVVVDSSGATRKVGLLPSSSAISGERALRLLLVGELTGHLWNKLFRRSVLTRIDYTRIRQHSDQAMVAQAFVASDIVAICPQTVYAYRLRSGSIIRSGAQRARSLEELAIVIRACVARSDATALRSVEYLYYSARFGLLSRMKDATSGAYVRAESRALIRKARSEMSFAHVSAILRRRDAARLALFTVAWLSPELYSRALRRRRGTD